MSRKPSVTTSSTRVPLRREHRIQGHGGAVHEPLDVGRVDAVRKPVEHRVGVIVGRCQHLAAGDEAGGAVPCDNIGERAADVDCDPDRGRHAYCPIQTSS